VLAFALLSRIVKTLPRLKSEKDSLNTAVLANADANAIRVHPYVLGLKSSTHLYVWWKRQLLRVGIFSQQL
jgi:hypothetical protein